MGQRNKPLAYLYRKRDKWVLSKVSDLSMKYSATSYAEAKHAARMFRWSVRREKHWDE
jgi:hypothetical protein